MKTGKIVAYICLPIFLLNGCTSSVPPARTELVLGTVCTVNLFEDGNQDLYVRIFHRLRELENTLSALLPESEISMVNDAAGTMPVQVSRDTLSVISRAKEFAELTGGKFDPTIGPLVRLWDVTNEIPQVPPPEA
ncbi:MAG: FAD:protein FMN transferase, partial [Spirochaetaceae bacterium]|nr:FAD:protein FMN transferase [Spirochaetaceae bacterium]